MKKQLLAAGALCLGLTAAAETVNIRSVRYAGPYVVQQPYQVDKLDVQSKEFSVTRLLDTPLKVDVIQQGSLFTGEILPNVSEGHALHLVGFAVENTRYTTAKLQIKGIQNFQLFVDGKRQTSEELVLEPNTHEIIIKYLSEAGVNDSLQISMETPQSNLLTLREDGKRVYTLQDVLHNKRYNDLKISPNGNYLMTSHTVNQAGGKSSKLTRIIELSTGRIVAEKNSNIDWMPKSDRYYFTRTGVNGLELVVVNLSDGKETILESELPQGSFQMAPSEDYLLYTLTQEGAKERDDIYEILEPEDRQPGWRKRTYLAKYDWKSHWMQPLTYGYHNVWATDISADGRFILMMSSENKLTERPTTRFNLYRLDVQTLQAEKLVEGDGFIANAGFSPDGTQVFVTGSPEAFNGIGKNVEEGQIPSMYDYQLYLLNIADRRVKPMSRDFNPNIQQVIWSKADNQLYFTAEHQDYVRLYRQNPTSGTIEELNTPEDLVKQISLSETKNPVVAYFGQSASNSDRLYTMDVKKQKSTLLEDLNAELLHDVQLGSCKAWSFVNSKGDTIHGRYYLPPHFDESKRYPMIVNYYGGCSPVERTFESRYPHHAYAALGYVVYVVEPSGATGFGQAFSARHVNTAGEGPAQDIIEGTQQFCKEHAFVNEQKIGCIGASYGGFMTQYLQTKTDIFAAAISHAGISDHSSYWGEGYWGYSYSEVSMAGSYPWKDQELYVNRSPLFNADKIHTPLLFLHGDKDMNVPVGESIQMYTALKLLGRETAMVLVSGQDHHIVDYTKRIQWEHTIYAWFAKWLQDDATWWNTLYKPKSL